MSPLVGAFGQGKSVAQVQDDCLDILALTGLLDKANVLAGSLTLLERKRLEMARALATGPELLLLDEIAGGLTEAECDQLVATIREVHMPAASPSSGSSTSCTRSWPWSTAFSSSTSAGRCRRANPRR